MLAMQEQSPASCVSSVSAIPGGQKKTAVGAAVS
jgi:hypothetical protein